MTMALGIGANAAVYGLLDSALFRPLPVRDPERLVFFPDTTQPSVPATRDFTRRTFERLRDGNRSLAGLAAYDSSRVSATIDGEPEMVLGDFVSVATMVKGLMLTFNSDMQEDKERVFDAADTVELSLAAMAAMIADLTADTAKMRAAAEPGFTTATDLADWVVRVLKKPFREAHHISGSIVKRAEELGVTLDKLPLAEMQKIDPAITPAVFDVLSLEASVNSRMSLGGTAPARVKEQVYFWRDKLK